MFIDDAGTTPDDAFVVGIFCTQVDGASRSVVQVALADERYGNTLHFNKISAQSSGWPDPCPDCRDGRPCPLDVWPDALVPLAITATESTITTIWNPGSASADVERSAEGAGRRQPTRPVPTPSRPPRPTRLLRDLPVVH